MSKKTKGQPRSTQPSRLSGSDGPLSVGDSIIDEQDLPSSEFTDGEQRFGETAAADASAETDAELVDEVDPSVNGETGAAGDDVIHLEIEEGIEQPQVGLISLQEEEAQARTAALKNVKIRPRINQRLRVPHPSGSRSMWLQLVAGKEMVVPAYVRDWLYEKNAL